MPEHVEAETVDAALQPEPHGVVHGPADIRIAPVEVGLLFQEGVVVILAGGRVPFPGRAAEIADPVIGRSAVLGRIAPAVPVVLGLGSGGRGMGRGWGGGGVWL